MSGFTVHKSGRLKSMWILLGGLQIDPYCIAHVVASEDIMSPSDPGSVPKSSPEEGAMVASWIGAQTTSTGSQIPDPVDGVLDPLPPTGNESHVHDPEKDPSLHIPAAPPTEHPLVPYTLLTQGLETTKRWRWSCSFTMDGCFEHWPFTGPPQGGGKSSFGGEVKGFSDSSPPPTTFPVCPRCSHYFFGLTMPDGDRLTALPLPSFFFHSFL